MNIKKPEINFHNFIIRKSYEPDNLKGSFKGNDKENLKNIQISVDENISGIIKGKNNLGYSHNNNFKNSTLKRTEKLNFIEYGSTLGYIKPNIKKGIDFIHKPRVKKKKKNDSIEFSMNSLNRPFVVNDKKIGFRK